MKNTVLTAGIIAAFLVTCLCAHAGTLTNVVTVLNILDLNVPDGTNSTLKIGGSTNGVSVVRSADGNDYIYSVTYTGADYSLDTINDTLAFDVRVQAWSGGAISNGLTAVGTAVNATATIGTTDRNVFFVGTTRSSVTDGNMNNGESLEFSLENFAFTLSEPGSALGVSDGFDQCSLKEGQGNTHETVYGEGTGLKTRVWQTPGTSDNFSPPLKPLYVSSPISLGGNTPYSWGVSSVDFGITITFSPPSSSVIMLE